MMERDRSPSPPAVRPARAFRTPKAIDDFGSFTEDVQDSVRQMLPTSGRRYTRAALFAVNFSSSDVPDVVPLRDELLDIFEKTYNWSVERYTIDSTQDHQSARYNFNMAIAAFFGKQAPTDAQDGDLICIYFSGHGFQDADSRLSICGSFAGEVPEPPCIPWSDMRPFLGLSPSPKHHRLAIMDCCAAGLACLGQSDVEVLGASAWESTAASSAQACFTRALMDELKSVNGAAVTTTQIVSRLQSRSSVHRGYSIPVHRRASFDRAPALIHRIEKTAPPSVSPQVNIVPKYSHVFISVKVTKGSTIPNSRQWASWLQTNLPRYVGHIEITAKWITASALVAVVLPIEIWLGLPEREAYSFMDYHRGWDSAASRERHAAVLALP